uniref:uncharacterized protein LOC124049759 isoform X1 n=1 Tax=Scatophagus argus TaxID=75038 RepID=UPI001ED7FD1B|nr:uncharacterized protein LOC124049759 isoform X1 [Scatophagus argus]
MEQKEGKTSPPFSAGYAGSCKKTDDTQQADEEELTRDRNELPCKNQECQPSVSEKRMTGDEKVSEEDVQDKPPISSSFPFFSSFVGKSVIHPDPPLPSPLPQQPNKYTISAQSEHSSARLQLQTSLPSLCWLDTFKRHDDFIPFDDVSPCPESSAVVLQSCSTGGKEEQAFQNKPEPQSHSSKLSASYKCNERSKMNSAVEHERTPITLNLRRKKKFKKDSPSTATINSADYVIDQLSPSAFTYRSFRTLGRTEKTDARPLPVHTQSKVGGDHSAPEEMLPPVNVGYTSTESSLSVDSHLQQPSVCSVEQATVSSLPSYDMFSLSQMTSSKNKKFPQPINFSNTPTFTDYTVDTDSTESDCDTNEYINSAVEHKRTSTGLSSRKKKNFKKHFSSTASAIDSTDYMSDQPLPGALTERGIIKSDSSVANATVGVHQDNSRGMVIHGKTGPSTLEVSTDTFGEVLDDDSDSPVFSEEATEWNKLFGITDYGSFQSPAWEMEHGPFTLERSRENQFEISPLQSESASGGESDAQLEMETSLTGVNYSGTNTQPTYCAPQTSSDSWLYGMHFLRSLSVPSLRESTSAENKTFTQTTNFSGTPLKYSTVFTDKIVDTDSTDCDCDPDPGLSSRKKKKIKKHFSSTASAIDSTDCMNDQPLPDDSSIANDAMGVDQYKSREKVVYGTVRPSTLVLSTNPSGALLDDDSDSLVFYDGEKERDKIFGSTDYGSFRSLAWQVEHGPFTLERSGDSQSQLMSEFVEIVSGCESEAQLETEASPTGVNYSVTNTQPTCCPLQMSSDPGWSRRGSSCLLRSLSVPSLSQVTSAKNKTFTRAKSLPDLLLENSFEEFTPDITVDETDEAYWLRCSCPGLYQCRVTGLVFHMEGEGDVVYRIVPWNRRLLTQHHKQPAGPLFDIKCLQQSVCQLHLPHCEIWSTDCFLSVAHVNDEGIEFITPHKITESHVAINITGFSAFGNVKDADSPPDPVRALVLLFYRPPADPDPTSLLNVLLLPRNVVLQDVLRTRKKLVGDESYIETSSHCKLHPKQEYTLSTCPEDDSFRVQPKKAEFDCDNYDNYIPSFQVRFKTIILNINLLLRDTRCSDTVWESEVYLSSTGVKRSCGPSILNLPSREKLFDIRSSFIDGISGPVLKSLLDKLFDKKVMTDSERESADEMQNKRDKARFVIDTVSKKGEAASSEMIGFLCETDPFLCEHLGLV